MMVVIKTLMVIAVEAMVFMKRIISETKDKDNDITNNQKQKNDSNTDNNQDDNY